MIVIEYVRFTPFDFTAQTTDYLLGVKDERIRVEIKFKAVWQIQSDAEALSTFAGQTIQFKDADGDPLIDAWEFQEFRVGDAIEITGSSSDGTRNITAISVDGSTITVDGAALTPEAGNTTALFNGITLLTGLSFRFNFIENNAAENYNSLIDGNENRYSLAGLATSMGLTATEHQGNYKSNKIGTVDIEGTANVNEFIITQEINLVPFVLAGQLEDLRAGIAPEYYFDADCLKYILEITLHKKLTNPNYIHASILDNGIFGNTGWVDENFNSGPPKYELLVTVFKDESGNIITEPDFSIVTSVEIFLISPDGLFSDTQQKFTLQHSYIPTEEDEYINTDSDVETNFMFDQNVNEIETAAVNGRGFGTPKQVLTDFEIEYVDDNNVTIKAKLDLSTEYRERLENLDGDFYLGATMQAVALSTEDSDKVHVLASDIEYKKDVSDPDSGGIETCFVPQSQNSTVEDGVKTQFSIVNIPTGAGNYQIQVGTSTIATAAWQGSDQATKEKLRDSINTATAFIPPFQCIGGDTFPFGTNGWTSEVDGTELIITAPFFGPDFDTPLPIFCKQASNAINMDLKTSGVESTLICKSNAGTFVEDWQIGKSIFFVEDFNTSKLKNISVRIYASHSTFGEFDLELKVFNVDSAPIVSGIQVISIDGERGYQMAVGNIFNDFSIKRRTDLDEGDKVYYELLYAFKIRWEDFISLPGASDQFYDPAVLNVGQNNNWNRYFATAGWTLFYKAEIVITKESFDNAISSLSTVEALNYGDADDWTYTTKAFDLETGLDVTGNAMSDRPYRMEIAFTKIVGAEPALDKVSGMIGVAPTSAGGTTLIREIVTNHVHEVDSPWISLTNDLLCKLEKVGSEYIFSAVIDNEKLRNMFPTATNFDFTGRLDEEINNLVYGDGVDVLTGDGQLILVAE